MRAQVAGVTVDANGNVLNSKPTNFPTGQLKVNGAVVVGGGISAPSGTGFLHITTGVADGASKLVADADVANNAAIAFSKISVANGAIGNALLTNSSVTISGHGLSLGGSLSLVESDITGLTSDLAAKISSIPVSNTIYVDPAGNNASALRGRHDLPFQTIAAAIAAASAGDLIFVRDGSYTWSSAITTSLSNLTIWAYGASVSASSQSNVVFLQLNGPGCKVFGFTLNGNWTNAADADSGIIEIGNTDTLVEDCYIHHSAGYGIRLVQNWSRTRLFRNRAEYTNIGITGALYGTNDVDGTDIAWNITQNNRHGGIRPSNNSGGAHTIKSLKVIGNTAINNGTGASDLNIELWGGHQRAIVSQNYVAGTPFGISLDTTTDSIVSDNIAYSGSYCAIEAAGSQRIKIFGNYVDGAALQNGGAAIVSSNTAVANIDIEHNYIANVAFGNGASIAAIGLSGVTGARVRFNDVVTNSAAPLSFTNCQNVEVTGNYFEQANDNAYGVYTEIAAASTYSGFYYRNNRFNHTAWSGNGYPMYYFYATGGATNSTFNDVHIEGTRSNAGFLGSGFYSANGNTLNATFKDNEPQENGLGTQYGFRDTINVYNATVRNTLTLGGTALTNNNLVLRNGITFNTSGAGWYRLLSYSAQELTGTIAIGGLGFANAWFDHDDIRFSVSAYGSANSITQLNSVLSHYAGNAIDQVRVGSNGSNAILEIHVNSATTGTVYVSVPDTNFDFWGTALYNALQSSPAKDPSVSGYTLTTLTVVPNAIALQGGLVLEGVTASKLLYVDASNQVQPVTIGSGLSFASGTLSNTASGGNVSTGGTLTSGNIVTGAGTQNIQDSGVALTNLQSQYQSVTVSAAGNTNSNIASVSHTMYVTANAGSGAYTATISIPTSGRAAGDRESVHVHYGASTNQTVEIHNNTSGGTLLFTWTGDGTGTDLVAEERFDGSAWYVHDAHFVW